MSWRRVVATLFVTGLLVGALGYLARTGPTRAREVLPADGTGSWWFPRGGPYVLGFDSPGPATLVVDGETIVSGHGLQSRRLVADPGVHRVVFTSTPGARLLWSPPWRSGPLEEVLPSSLSPDPPTRAEFTSPGTDHLGAALAAGLVFVLLWSLLRLSRPFEDGRIWGPGLVIFVAAVAARLVGVRSGGPVAGEGELYATGLNLLRGLLAGVPPPEGPPVALFFAGIGALAEDGYFVGRAIFAGLGAGACVFAFAAGSRLFGVRAGFFGGLTCALLPSLIAHGRLLDVSSPSLFFITMAVWVALAATQDDGERPVWLTLRLIGAGLALGLAVATRVESSFCLPVVLLAAMVPARRPHVVRTVLLVLLVVPLALGATTLTVWPSVAEHLPALVPTEAPVPYLAELALASTPLLFLVLAGLGGGLRALFRRERAWLVVVPWLAAPLAVTLLPERPMELGAILPALVPLAIAVGAGLDALLARAPSVAFVLGLLFVGYLVVVCTRIHPHYHAFYGVHVGGPAGVAESGAYPLGARGEGVGRAVGFINARARPGARVASLVQPPDVAWFRADLWPGLSDVVQIDTDWVIVNAPRLRGFAPPPGARLELDVAIEGAALVRVYQIVRVAEQ